MSDTEDGAQIRQQAQAPPQQSHPYLVATITPSGGLIVHMHWINQPAEPLAFTNEADFSAWLKKSVNQCSERLPMGIRPQHQQGQIRASVNQLPLTEEEYLTGERPTIAVRMRSLIGGRQA